MLGNVKRDDYLLDITETHETRVRVRRGMRGEREYAE